MALVLIPLPHRDFDPTEAGVSWRLVNQRGHRILFATPDGTLSCADPIMLTGKGLGMFAPFIKTDRNGRSAYDEMVRSEEFQHPIAYQEIQPDDFDALILPGGHAPGMRPYLESAQLQTLVARLFERNRPVGAICHGVLIAARARSADGKSVLYGRRTTALPKRMELAGWLLTCLYLGSYFRTYPLPVEDEVRTALAAPTDFISGPMMIRRDSPGHLQIGFTVRDGNYLSARWLGDAHRFAHDFVAMLE
jgi:protease I